jgi:hypothetical protein
MIIWPTSFLGDALPCHFTFFSFPLFDQGLMTDRQIGTAATCVSLTREFFNHGKYCTVNTPWP